MKYTIFKTGKSYKFIYDMYSIGINNIISLSKCVKIIMHIKNAQLLNVPSSNFFKSFLNELVLEVDFFRDIGKLFHKIDPEYIKDFL